MSDCHFLFNPGVWLGNGSIQLAGSETALKYYTRWTIGGINEGVIHTIQEVEIYGAEKISNHYRLSEITAASFKVELENELFGQLVGKGLIEVSRIAWEFSELRSPFHGFELFEREQEDQYVVHAEFLGKEQTKSLIKGKVWKKFE